MNFGQTNSIFEVKRCNLDKQTTTFEDIKQHGTNKFNFVYPVIIRCLCKFYCSIFILVEEEVFFGGVV